MNASMGREKYLAIALTLAALLLAGVLVWEWNQALNLQRELLKMRNIPAVAAKPLNILPEFSLPPEDAGFPELISRSLFSINRRSSAVASKDGVAAMKKGQFVLVGVLITPQRSSAQLRDVQTNKAETVALNGVVRGMTVGEVGPSKVVLRQGAESEELVLNVQTGPKSAAARAPGPVAAPTTLNAAPHLAASAPASAPGAPPPEITQRHTELKKK
ncbi:hypothetical protein HZ993_12185 [Rhodoferax sp. AJA081-3]|uniref:hypothetical protein n=1 Tax=Rhodoferax sp. AJA081-3 TaxID=2752316 RepID=UPI001ADF8CDD|nr:hypothetical protein [Rhodoferax sp. AJA081-3]QTN26112.1 hypothetical protein HZ993_12185 [Rhodoferax sp. AJA081-3]